MVLLIARALLLYFGAVFVAVAAVNDLPGLQPGTMALYALGGLCFGVHALCE